MSSIKLLLFLFIWTFSTTALSVNSAHIYGVELLVADSSDNSVESRFGHSLLRFIINPDNPFEDVILSFEANVPENDSKEKLIYKGITGQYSSIIRPMKMIDLLMYYSQNENRGFTRVILRLSTKKMTDLFNLAQEIIKDPKSIPNYSFFNFNCARMVTWFLAEANLKINTNPVIPTHLPIALSQSFLAPWKNIKVPSGSSIMNKLDYSLVNDQIVISDSELQSLSESEAFILISGDYLFSVKTRTTLKERTKKSKLTLIKIFNLEAKEPYFYVDSLESKPVNLEQTSTELALVYSQKFWSIKLSKHKSHKTIVKMKQIFFERRNFDILKKSNTAIYNLINDFLKKEKSI